VISSPPNSAQFVRPNPFESSVVNPSRLIDQLNQLNDEQFLAVSKRILGPDGVRRALLIALNPNPFANESEQLGHILSVENAITWVLEQKI